MYKFADLFQEGLHFLRLFIDKDAGVAQLARAADL